MMNKTMIADSDLNIVNGGSTIVNTGNPAYISGSTPKWVIGDVLRVKYCDPNGNSCRAKCVVLGVSNDHIAGPSGSEYAYDVMIVWLPLSCPAASTDVGKMFTLCESCLSQD